MSAPGKLALLGTGHVGRAVLARLAAWNGRGPGARVRLVAVADTRSLRVLGDDGDGGGVVHACDGDHAQAAIRVLGGTGTRIVLDATACDGVAARHAQWLEAGVHVATACKLGQGADLARWQAIRAAVTRGDARYGDSATVGAGLPLLRSIRALREGGDRIHDIAGVLSGSLSWLLSHDDGRRPFAALVDEARALGYTEPDPRIDLSGEDVRRKLLILARTAGVPLERGAVDVRPLDAGGLASLRGEKARGRVLRYVARLQCGGGGSPTCARVGLEALAPDDPLAAGTGTDNRVAIRSDRYAAQPLLIQGPGAGAGVTAAALLDDALGIAAAGVPYGAGADTRDSDARYAASGCGWSMA